MNTPPIFTAVTAPGQAPAFQKLTDLRVGQRLVGRVLRLADGGRILIDLGKMLAVAHSEIPLEVGQEIPLQVIQAGMPVRLRLDSDMLFRLPEALSPFTPTDTLPADDQARALRIIGQFLGAQTKAPPTDAAGPYLPAGPAEAGRPAFNDSAIPERVRIALQRLQTLFDPMDPQASSVHQAQWLRSAIENSGIFFEIKLANVLQQNPIDAPQDKPSDPVEEAAPPAYRTASPIAQTVHQILTQDLKAQLIVLQNFYNDTDEPDAGYGIKAGDAAHLRRTIDLLLTHVERQQQQAIRHAGDNEWFHVFNHMLPIKEQPRQVRLKVYYPKKGRGAAAPRHCIALLLDMDRLGPLRVDLGLLERRLSITFYVRDAHVRLAFDRCTATVADALAGLFDHIQITTHINWQKIAQFDEEDRWGAAPAGGIDLHA